MMSIVPGSFSSRRCRTAAAIAQAKLEAADVRQASELRREVQRAYEMQLREGSSSIHQYAPRWRSKAAAQAAASRRARHVHATLSPQSSTVEYPSTPTEDHSSLVAACSMPTKNSIHNRASLLK